MFSLKVAEKLTFVNFKLTQMLGAWLRRLAAVLRALRQLQLTRRSAADLLRRRAPEIASALAASRFGARALVELYPHATAPRVAASGAPSGNFGNFSNFSNFGNFELTQALGAWLLAASRGGASRISSIQRSRRHSAPGRLRRLVALLRGLPKF